MLTQASNGRCTRMFVGAPSQEQKTRNNAFGKGALTLLDVSFLMENSHEYNPPASLYPYH